MFISFNALWFDLNHDPLCYLRKCCSSRVWNSSKEAAWGIRGHHIPSHTLISLVSDCTRLGSGNEEESSYSSRPTSLSSRHELDWVWADGRVWAICGPPCRACRPLALSSIRRADRVTLAQRLICIDKLCTEVDQTIKQLLRQFARPIYLQEQYKYNVKCSRGWVN